MGKFDKETKILRHDVFIEIRQQLFKYISDTIIEEKNFLEGFKKDELTDEEDTYWINKDATFETYRKLLTDENGDCKIKFDFDSEQLATSEIKSINTLQRVYIDIITPGIKFPFVTENVYKCPQCETITVKKSYDVICSKGQIHCSGTYTYTNSEGDLKSKACKYYIYPDTEVSTLTDAYAVDVSYITEDRKSVV